MLQNNIINFLQYGKNLYFSERSLDSFSYRLLTAHKNFKTVRETIDRNQSQPPKNKLVKELFFRNEHPFSNRDTFFS